MYWIQPSKNQVSSFLIAHLSQPARTMGPCTCQVGIILVISTISSYYDVENARLKVNHFSSFLYGSLTYSDDLISFDGFPSNSRIFFQVLLVSITSNTMTTATSSFRFVCSRRIDTHFTKPYSWGFFQIGSHFSPMPSKPVAQNWIIKGIVRCFLHGIRLCAWTKPCYSSE